jgi:NADH-quinone oxidoreductase subunit J
MHDTLIHTIFYIFSFIAVASALMVISQNNPVRCVLFLVLTFFASAGIWMIAGAEFLSLILVLVYVGAVMTLFLFVVMMLNIDTESMKSHFLRYLPFGLVIVSLFVGLLLVAIPNQAFKPINTVEQKMNVQGSELLENHTQQATEVAKPTLSNTESLGLVLYTDYLLAFELAAVILLVAIIAAITLVHRGAVRSKRQNIKEQIMTRSADRVHLVHMKSEK